MNNDVMFSSTTGEWETPEDLFKKLNKEFHFTLDVCATAENAKCDKYYTKAADGLSQVWEGNVWCNPPYGRDVGRWVQKAHESAAENTTVVMLLPARTDTRWFHDYINGIAEVRFLRGRLRFGDARNTAPFPSMVVVFRPILDAVPVVRCKNCKPIPGRQDRKAPPPRSLLSGQSQCRLPTILAAFSAPGCRP